MGIANAELDTVQKILDDSESPDYEKAMEKQGIYKKFIIFLIFFKNGTIQTENLVI